MSRQNAFVAVHIGLLLTAVVLLAKEHCTGYSAAYLVA
jgi:hypothetical protein